MENCRSSSSYKWDEPITVAAQYLHLFYKKENLARNIMVETPKYFSYNQKT